MFWLCPTYMITGPPPSPPLTRILCEIDFAQNPGGGPLLENMQIADWPANIPGKKEIF